VVALAIIDPDDAERVMQYRWSLNGKGKQGGYARRNVKRRIDGRVVQSTITLHRFVMGITDPAVQVDHKNRDPLDCRKDNLRLATNAQNHQNMGPNANGRSGFRGVHWNEARQKWHAKVRLNYRHIYLGSFSTPEEANAAVCAWRAEHMPYSNEDQHG
jgi:hypothetical protein